MSVGGVGACESQHLSLFLTPAYTTQLAWRQISLLSVLLHWSTHTSCVNVTRKLRLLQYRFFQNSSGGVKLGSVIFQKTQQQCMLAECSQVKSSNYSGCVWDIHLELILQECQVMGQLPLQWQARLKMLRRQAKTGVLLRDVNKVLCAVPCSIRMV